MSDSSTPTNPPPPDPTAIPIPVICDACAAKGLAGDARFAAIPDILNFKPVERRLHANNWTAAVQRAFVAALAITGSMRKAARAVGRYANGAEQLRKAPGGKEFDRACEAALEIYREREYRRINANLVELAEEEEAEFARIGKRHHDAPDPRSIPESEMGEEEHEELMQNIRQKLMSVRRWYLASIADDPRKRKAWITLTGAPVDWDHAREMIPQDNEPFPLTDAETYRVVNMRKPAMVLTVDAGLMNHHLGLPGPLDPLKAELAAAERLRKAKHSEEEVRAQLEIRAEHLAKGWTEDENGNLLSPEGDPA